MSINRLKEKNQNIFKFEYKMLKQTFCETLNYLW